MGWLGKLVGGTIGFALGGPLGAIAGAAFGHAFDTSEQRYLEGDRMRPGPGQRLSNSEQAQMTFFVAAFSMLAKLVKVDGRVAREEVASIEQFMIHDLHLDAQSRMVAMNIFHTALESPGSFEDFATQFYGQFQMQPQLLEVMIDILLRVSVADGTLNPAEEALILKAVKTFRFSDTQYRTIKSKYVRDIDKHYATLGTDRNATDEQIKKQYRKLVHEYHPDKIASKGLPEEFTRFAENKFREIQEAYDSIKKERHLN
jgi:DnaJ like chaperone protein